MNQRWLKQTTFYDPSDPNNPETGNCSEAAFASILNLGYIPPTFGRFTGTSAEYWDDFATAAQAHGFTLFTRVGHVVFPGLYLASGPSIRGCNHMVVMKEGFLVHDPHPSDAGIKYVDFTHYLVPLDPSRYTHPVGEPHEQG